MMRAHGTKTGLTALCVVAIAFAGCVSETGATMCDGPPLEGGMDDSGDTVTIGALLPLTGDGASYGEPAENGIELAVEEINAAGGVGGKTLDVVYGDSRFPNTQEAALAMEDLIGQDVQFVIGATASDSSAAAKQKANEASVIQMSPGSTRPDLTGPDHGCFFRVIPNDAVQGPQAAQFLYEDLGADELVVMYETTAYGQGLRETFIPAYEGLGGTVVGEPISWDQDDVTPYGSKAEEAVARGTDFIWVPGQAPNVANLIREIRDAGFTGTVVGSEALENSEVFDVASEAVDGAFFTKASPPADQAQAFADKYEDRWGEQPGVFSAYAYDATYVAAEGIETVGNDAFALRDWLENDAAVSGRVTTDTIQFDQNGDVATGGYNLWVADSGNETFAPASV